jgi:hypothetical protein
MAFCLDLFAKKRQPTSARPYLNRDNTIENSDTYASEIKFHINNKNNNNKNNKTLTI